tara:strand:+ start:335 stop:610 length:276 start_codon:yes stop_codon:yes gene_type:complete
MDSSKYYPYNIPFYTDVNFIDVKFINNEDHIINIFFIKGDIQGDLAALIFPHSERKYQFPESSIVAIISDKKPNKYHCFIKLKNNMTYIYP